MMKLSFVAFLLMLVFFSGCGGAKSSTVSESSINQNQLTQVIGYWSPDVYSNYSYEFFPSIFIGPFTPQFPVQLKTGRRFKEGKVDGYFYWNIQSNGSVNIYMIDNSCLGVIPFNACTTTGSALITMQGDSVRNAKWTIAYDNNLDGIVDNKTIDVYRKGSIDLSKLPQGEFFLRHQEYYDTPTRLSISGHTISIRMDQFSLPITLSMNFNTDITPAIEFKGSKNEAITIVQEFFVGNGIGYQDFTVKEWFENVKLLPSGNDGYILSYDMHREVQVPPTIDRGLVQIGDYEMVFRKTDIASIVSTYIIGNKIHAMDKFYTFIHAGFNENFVLDAGGNEINFTSSTEGILSHTDIHDGSYSEARNFIWSQHDDGSLTLTFPNYGSVILKFISSINGGFSILIANPDPNWGLKYSIQDWIEDGPVVVNESNLPGRYKLLTADFGIERNIVFNKDKTLSGDVHGYWFQDFNGDIVSYECITLSGQQISNYSDCIATFDNFFNVSFAHVRRARFMHVDGNSYQSKYDAVVRGSGDGFHFPNLITVAYTYRWLRVGD